MFHASGLSEKFHLLADFGGAVLAGRELENGWGYQFVTWIWDCSRTGVSHGHYYEEDFCGAKQDFAVRSGLISKAQLFSLEERAELYRATGYLLDEGSELEDGQLKALQTDVYKRQAVDHVAINYGKPNQKELQEMTLAEAERYCAEGQFAPGSMLPKVQAAMNFVKSGKGRKAIIASLEKAPEAIEGKSGTVIHM